LTAVLSKVMQNVYCRSDGLCWADARAERTGSINAEEEACGILSTVDQFFLDES